MEASPAAHTKKQAEGNVFRIVERNCATTAGAGQPETHLMADNTEAICRGRGSPARWQLHVCVIRPGNTRRQGLYVSQPY
jgi:hypothetical protein